MGRAPGEGVRPRRRSGAGGGAAGGIGAAGLAVGAEVVSGAELVLDAVGFDERLSSAALVVTGEGSWDAQSRRGKAPGVVAARAAAAGVPAALVAGKVEEGAADGFAWVSDLTTVAGSAEAAMADAERLLVRAGRDLGEQLRSARGVADVTIERPMVRGERR